MSPRFLKSVQDIYARFGLYAASWFLLESALNLVFFLDCLHIIVLDRRELNPLDASARQRLDSRIAREGELLSLSEDPRWEINETKLSFFRAGDSCVLSLVDGQPAGYTWVHAAGRPELIPGLMLSIPPEYLYNYAGLTLPQYRGAGLQPYRHHAVLNNPLWKDRRALLGYVRATNFASRKGQSKSGYHKVGSVWLMGTRHHFAAFLSRSLREMGIRRLSCPNKRVGM